MSEYLSHIAALSLNLAETVQPRLAGMFEPSEMDLSLNGPGNGSRNGSDDAYDLAGELPVFPGNSVTPATVKPDSTRSASSTNVVSLQNEIRPQVTLVAEPRQPQQKVVVNDATQQVLNTHSVPSNAPLMEPQATLKTSNADRAIPLATSHTPSIDRIIERTVVERIPSISPVIQQHHAEPVNHELALPCGDQKDQQDIRKIQPDKIESTSTTAASPGKWVVEPHIQTYTPPKESPRVESINSTAPAPSIQVTIGRIEIRATPGADKTVSKPRAAATTMSLDDYLSRRNGGKS